MKFTLILTATVLATITACNSGSQNPTEEKSHDSVAALVETPAPAPAAPGFVSGVVEEVTQGKDGYTAKIRSSADSVYYVTISHANLTDHAQYRSAKAGDTLTVSGDRWEMEGKAQITVRELK